LVTIVVAAVVAAVLGVAIGLLSRRRRHRPRERSGRLEIGDRPRGPSSTPPSPPAPQPDPAGQVDFQAAVWEATRRVDRGRGGVPSPEAAGSAADDAALLDDFASDLRRVAPQPPPTPGPELPR